MNFTSASAAVLGREAMRELDARTIASGIASGGLMERAGAALAGFIADAAATGIRLPDRGTQGPPRLLVLAGRGNNGGDGFVAARLLSAEGWRCTVALAGCEPTLGSDASANLAEWRRIGGQVIEMDEALRRLREGATGFHAGLDAIFGTGLVRAVERADAELIRCLNHSGLPVVSADIPSGLCSDTGHPLGIAVRARATLTIGAAKPGLFLAEGPSFTGRVRVADIGLLEPARVGIAACGVVLDPATTAGSWPHRDPMAHKGSRGHVLLIAGSRGKTGAAVLAARAALRCGAGLVTVATVADGQSAVCASLPEAMTLRLAAGADGEVDRSCVEALEGAMAAADSIVVGPGLGTGAGAEAVVEAALAAARPVVLDADALNVVARWDAERRRTIFRRRAKPGTATVLTPHPGEMARLVSGTTAEVQRERHLVASNLAKSLDGIVVLKGAATIVCDDSRIAYNLSGNAGMAAGGMGDVLAGICGALAAVPAVRNGSGNGWPDVFEAMCLAVFVHGAAGDVLASRTGAGFLAGELADAVPEVLATRHPR